MSGLRDHPTSKNTNSNRLRSRFHILSNFDLFVFIQGWQRRQSRKLDRLEKVIPPSDPSWISGRVVAAVDVFNPLLGKRGATRVYGPQKGLAGETEIRVLEAALTRLADVVADWRKNDLRDRPGAGAAGGLGFGLMAFCGAEVHRGFDQVPSYSVWLKRLPNLISSSLVQEALTHRLSRAKRRRALPNSLAALGSHVLRLPGELTRLPAAPPRTLRRNHGPGRGSDFRCGGHSARSGIAACSRGRTCVALEFLANRMKTARFFSEPPHCLLLGVETLHN
jgi:Glycerate kinase family